VKTSKVICSLVVAGSFLLILPGAVQALEVGDIVELPAVQIPFEELNAGLKTEYLYDQQGGGAQMMKLDAEILLGVKTDSIDPEEGMLINFQGVNAVAEGKVPDWFLPIPEGAFHNTGNGKHKMSGTPAELGIQLLVVMDNEIVADLTDAIETIKAMVTQSGVDNPTFNVKLTAIGFFEGHDPQWLPAGATAGIEIFLPAVNGFTDGGGISH
jgi:hypothetical protein